MEMPHIYHRPLYERDAKTFKQNIYKQKITFEYYQEKPQSHTVDQFKAP